MNESTATDFPGIPEHFEWAEPKSIIIQKMDRAANFNFTRNWWRRGHVVICVELFDHCRRHE